jgi:hypothetical protein
MASGEFGGGETCLLEMTTEKDAEASLTRRLDYPMGLLRKIFLHWIGNTDLDTTKQSDAIVVLSLGGIIEDRNQSHRPCFPTTRQISLQACS